MAKPDLTREKKRTPLDMQAAGRFIKHGVTQSTFAQPRSSQETAPSTFVPVKVTSKIIARAEYEQELANESSEEEEELKIFDGDEEEEEDEEGREGDDDDDDDDEASDSHGRADERSNEKVKEEQTGTKRRRSSDTSLGDVSGSLTSDVNQIKA